MAILEVTNLHTYFDTADGTVRAVDGASLTVDRGEIVGIVGESGSGKSVFARSIMGLHKPGRITDGSIEFDGVDLTAVDEDTRRQYRGTKMSMVFQDPTTTLNPVFDVGEQIAESLRIHDDSTGQSLLDFLGVPPVSNRSAWRSHRERAVELMEQVGIADPKDRVDAYPHELSGGMAQRVMLAIALAGDPDLLIADEPTTALDTTTQARILEQLRELATETDTAVVVISHDFGVIANLCDRGLVLYGGEVMERGPTDRLLESPEHPYTRGLLSCLLDGNDNRTKLPTIAGSVPERFAVTGCPFASRCTHATDRCSEFDPPAIEVGPDHEVVCGELNALGDATGSVGEGSTSANPTAKTEHPTDGLSTQSDDCSAISDGIAADGASELLDSPSDADGESQSDSVDGTRTQATDTTHSTPNDGSRETPIDRTQEDPILEARGVSRVFDLTDSAIKRLLGRDRSLQAVDDVDFAVYPNEIVGIVGESGSGKSTLAKLLTGLQTPTEGTVLFDSQPVGVVEERTADQLANVGVVFQNPRASINPRQRIHEAIAEPLREQGWETSRCHDRVRELLDLVDLPTGFASRRPNQLSGGQLQRVAIARAIALEPRVLVLDEPVSALDVSVRARLLNLLRELQNRLGLTIVVISHDLDVVRHIADRVAVMYLGRIAERGPAPTVFERPAHPYTAALLDAVPRVTDSGEPVQLEGPVPSAVDTPEGCSFHPRCPISEPECERTDPNCKAVGKAHARCHFAEEVAAQGIRNVGAAAEGERSFIENAPGDDLRELTEELDDADR